MARAQVGLHQMQVSRSASSSHRRTLTAVFAAFGAAIGALAGSMPSVMRNAGMDGETFGLGLTLSTLMTVMAMSMGGRIARHASSRQVLLAVLPVFAVSLLAYLTSASPIWFFVAIPLMGVCFGLTDLFMNAEAVALEHDLNRPVFMAFHGAVSTGVGVMPVAASYLSTAVGTLSVGLVVAAFFAVAWWMVLLHVAPRVLTTGVYGAHCRFRGVRRIKSLRLERHLIRCGRLRAGTSCSMHLCFVGAARTAEPSRRLELRFTADGGPAHLGASGLRLRGH